MFTAKYPIGEFVGPLEHIPNIILVPAVFLVFYWIYYCAVVTNEIWSWTIGSKLNKCLKIFAVWAVPFVAAIYFKRKLGANTKLKIKGTPGFFGDHHHFWNRD